MSLEFGDKIFFSHKQVRKDVDRGRKVWLDKPVTEDGEASYPGLFLGWRWISNGHFEAENGSELIVAGGYDEYVTDEHFKVALIAYDEKKNPVYVLPKHMLRRTAPSTCSHCGRSNR